MMLTGHNDDSVLKTVHRVSMDVVLLRWLQSTSAHTKSVFLYKFLCVTVLEV